MNKPDTPRIMKEAQGLIKMLCEGKPWEYVPFSEKDKAYAERYSEIGPECDVIVHRDSNGIYSVIAPGKDSYARANSLETYNLLIELHQQNYKVPELLTERLLGESMTGMYSTSKSGESKKLLISLLDKAEGAVNEFSRLWDEHIEAVEIAQQFHIEETFSIELAGFKTKAQAEAFLSWYSNSGEQEASEDFTCRVEEGSLDVTYMGITSNMWEGSTMKVVMDIQE